MIEAPCRQSDAGCAIGVGNAGGRFVKRRPKSLPGFFASVPAFPNSLLELYSYAPAIHRAEVQVARAHARVTIAYPLSPRLNAILEFPRFDFLNFGAPTG